MRTHTDALLHPVEGVDKPSGYQFKDAKRANITGMSLLARSLQEHITGSKPKEMRSLTKGLFL